MKVIEFLTAKNTKSKEIPFFTMSVAAGLPTSVDDNVDKFIDINEFLIQNPATTFFAKIDGSSMMNLGLNQDDIIIFDTSLKPKDGKLVIVEYKNDFSVKMYRIIKDNAFIQSDDNTFLPLNFEPFETMKIIGVITKVIHKL